MKVTVIDVENEVKHTSGLLRNNPDFNDKLSVKVCVGLDDKGLTIVFGPDDDADVHIHEELLFHVMGYKPNTRGGGKINLSNKGSKVVADWSRNRSQSLGPIPEEFKETVMQGLQVLIR